jgi:hypothetical protein
MSRAPLAAFSISVILLLTTPPCMGTHSSFGALRTRSVVVDGALLLPINVFRLPGTPQRYWHRWWEPRLQKQWGYRGRCRRTCPQQDWSKTPNPHWERWLVVFLRSRGSTSMPGVPAASKAPSPQVLCIELGGFFGAWEPHGFLEAPRP